MRVAYNIAACRLKIFRLCNCRWNKADDWHRI